MKTVIHVNQHVIKKNSKDGTDDPVLTVKTYKENLYAHEVVINGPSKVIYSPTNLFLVEQKSGLKHFLRLT